MKGFESSARPPEADFTPQRTAGILEAACGRAGFDASGAELLRHHTNAVYRLRTAPVVVKIGRPSQTSGTNVVALTRWLQARDVPAAPPVDVAQPISLSGCSVTFWRHLPQRREITAPELAHPLAQLHALSADTGVELPQHDTAKTFEKINRSIRNSSVLDESDTQFLTQKARDLRAQAASISYQLDRAPIHGDAHHKNALWNSDTNCAVLCDWDNAAVGPPEWDLVTIEVHCRRFAYPRDEYPKFCQAYGRDIRDWDGYCWLRDVRELRMITTNAWKSRPGSPSAREVRRRVRALRSGEDISWRIL